VRESISVALNPQFVMFVMAVMEEKPVRNRSGLLYPHLQVVQDEIQLTLLICGIYIRGCNHPF
jgi:hypothetical protein